MAPTDADLAAKLDALPKTDLDDLRRHWRRLYRSPPPMIGRDLLVLGVAWKLQAQVLGGLAPATRRRIAGLVATMEDKGDLTKARMSQLKPGSRLMRVWQGRTHTVLVLEDGYEWRGAHHASLSAIARSITGTRWSGPRFFGLDKPMKAKKADANG
jgi:hypothetical protein